MNSAAYLKTTLIFEDYSERVVYGEEEEQEALQNSINWAFRESSEEVQAEIYTKVWERWQKAEINARFLVTQRVLEGYVK